jgi:mRNA-degrading endonuclease toxin of MazEF toxin-antitoxin module
MAREQWVPSPGHIIRTHVPFANSEKTKERFPVVVSSSEFNRKYPEVIVAFTTSSINVHHPRSYDVEISNKHPEFGLTGLPHSTTVRCGRLWTIDKHKISDVIGVVPDGLLTDIQRLVLECFTEQPKDKNAGFGKSS